MRCFRRHYARPLQLHGAISGLFAEKCMEMLPTMAIIKQSVCTVQCRRTSTVLYAPAFYKQHRLQVLSESLTASGLSDNLPENSTPNGSPQKKPVGQMYLTGSIVQPEVMMTKFYNNSTVHGSKNSQNKTVKTPLLTSYTDEFSFRKLDSANTPARSVQKR